MSVSFFQGRGGSQNRAGRAMGSPVEIEFDYKSFAKLEKKLSGMRRTLAKNAFAAASKVSLMLINKETAKKIKMETFAAKPKKGGLRKAATKKAGYKYKTVRLGKSGVMEAKTFINYKKPGLRHAHLMDQGFQHRGNAIIKARHFRTKAFLGKRAEAARKFLEALRVGIELAAKDPKGRVRSKAIEAKVGKSW